MGTKVRSGGRFFINGKDGQPANGWKVETFTAGSAGVLGTDDKATYTDYTLATPHANPIILDERGEAEVWWNDTYLIKVYDENDVLIYSLDYFGSGEDPAVDTEVTPLNGSFETDDNGDGIPNNWTENENTNGTVAIDDTDADHGLQCLKFTGTDANGGGTAESDKFAVQPGEYRLMEFTYKSSAVDTLNSVDVKWYNLAGTLLSTTNVWSEGAANSLTWLTQAVAITAPASAVQATVLITGVNSGGTTTIGNTKFDNVRMPLVDNGVIRQVSVADAVNQLQITNSITTNAVLIDPVGDDANITITASGKGSGKFNVDGNSATSTLATTATTANNLGGSNLTGDVTNSGNTISLASNSVDSAEIVAGAVDTSELAGGAVTADKIGSGAVTRAKLSTTADVSNSGSLSALQWIDIQMDAYCFFPMIYGAAHQLVLYGDDADGASADNPRVSMKNIDTTQSRNYALDYRYVTA